ncbi:MAG: GGDEF domain-containing protein [Burkholderiaceae bacterium]
MQSNLPNKRTVAAATRTLAVLNKQADGLRTELVQLRQDVAEGQRDFSAERTSQLQEANGQLVLAALHAETIAETAVSDLGEVVRSSQRDALTDTPNRALMLDRLERAIATARRRRTCIAVVFLDLDHFKQINDTLGHAVGDQVLQLVARRLESVVRDSDTVSRHGGDEFLILLTGISRASDAAQIADKIVAALKAPSRVGGCVLHLSASVGVTVYPEDGEDAATLINRADAAMYRSKRSGLGSVEFHSKETSSDRSLELFTADALP